MKEIRSYLNNQNILEKKDEEQLMKSSAEQGCTDIVVDNHRWTNLAWEIRQLISPDDFNAVCWFVILGDKKKTSTSVKNHNKEASPQIYVAFYFLILTF